MPPFADRLRRRPSSSPPPDRPRRKLPQHADEVDWDGPRPTVAFLRLVRSALREVPQPSVVVAAGRQADAWADLFARAWGGVALTVVREDEDPAEAHVRLSATGPFDVVVQAADTTGLAQARLFQRIFMHLRDGGTYLTPRLVPLTEDDVRTAERLDAGEPPQREDGPRERPYVGDLWEMVSAGQAARIRDFEDGLDRGGLSFRDARGLGRHLLETHVHSKMLVIRTEKKSCPKLSEPETNAFLEARPEVGRVVATVPPAEVVARPGAVHNLGGDDPYLDARMLAPQISLRAYHEPVCSRGQAVGSNGVVLADSFRFPFSTRLTNIYVEESAPRFGAIRRDTSDAPVLPGTWFHLDSEWPGQFGHMVLERLSRMWAWKEVKERHPDAKVLVSVHDRPPFELHQFEWDLFEAAGIAREDVHEFVDPCRPELLYSATPMFSLSEYVHPGIRDLWQSIGDALAAKASGGPRPERVFFTRPSSIKRACRNAPDVERLFERHGFTVMRPEDHTLADQVAIVRAADVIGGFVGSGLFTTALRPEPTTVFTVGPTSYRARNEQLIAAVLGHAVVAAWSAPDLDHPVGGWSNDAFFSGFTFDVQSEGVFLEEQLAALGKPT